MSLSLKKQSKTGNSTSNQPQQPKVWTISADDGDELMDEDALLAPSDLQVHLIMHQTVSPPLNLCVYPYLNSVLPRTAAEASPCCRRPERLRAFGGAQGLQKLHLRPR